ncbi:polysaccharide deacetylase family protein [Sphaerisporangium krabiense]|uniref:Peptidoglycan/xylan/chitin deacetylase (PgdA/CDA1 family) n=1 Tax=Sphaerisporangium krabiense TaxID=763782 RepID=A0A7W9DMY9_9ACTN|nr:polysaccharide deacetylase family protein [Sphaerisporangium krabiense]MBB5624861.1 peptidoglycan/xylan/chitin deacetylase (PgdA/CDA1 family) [Sphaerisporangium krabiense]
MMRRFVPVAAAVALLAATLPASAEEPASASAKGVDCARVKCIALTFDDGPGPYTAKLLDILRAHRTKVTFFLIGGRVEKDPRTARRIARDGHQIGNHTYDHPHLTTLFDDEIRDEIARAQDAIQAATGRRPDILRPPYGDTDARVGAIAAEFGLSQIVWNGSSRDWELRNAVAIREKVLGLAKRDRVVLMHDIQPATVKAMPRILTALEKKGYHVVTVEKLLRGRRLSAGETFPVGGWN